MVSINDMIGHIFPGGYRDIEAGTPALRAGGSFIYLFIYLLSFI